MIIMIKSHLLKVAFVIKTLLNHSIQPSDTFSCLLFLVQKTPKLHLKL
jgi:hypothetical protein